MTTPLVISKNRSIDQSENYEFLREEGLDYIERLSSNLWTDYNVHDPGITMVEAMCYAITDLGYRTGMPMKDILAKEGMDYSQEVPPLFTARNILTNNPLTVTDFRKLLADIEGIKNAWLDIADCQEVDFYAKCESSSLNYFQPEHKIKLEKLEIENGISKVFKRIIDDPDNKEIQFIKVPFSIKSHDSVQNIDITYILEIPLPGWESIDNERVEFLDFINLDTFSGIFFQNIIFDNPSGKWQADIRVKFIKEGVADTVLLKDVLIEGVADISTRSALEQFLKVLNDKNPFVQYQQKIKHKLALETEHTIRLRGLNEVLLEYDLDDNFGDLNSNLLNYKLVIEEPGMEKGRELDLEINMPSWTHIFESIKKYEPFISANSFTYDLINSFEDSVNNIFTTDIEIEYTLNGTTKSFIWEAIVFKGISIQSELEKDLANILIHFQSKLQRLLDITRRVETSLHEHRNLCEDYKKISNICVNDIAVCVDVILENNASLVKTQAQILFEIQQYISPSIRFYSLKEMLDKDIPSEDIFNGPKLQHGFIISEEIEKSSLSLKRFIYASDIINIIQDIPGVLAVKDLQLTKYDKGGNPILPSQRWCVRVDPNHKAELNIKKSKILFFKEELPYVLSDNLYDKMLEEMSKLRALHERYKLVNPNNDLPIPEGRPLQLENYAPLRISLPQTYGVGITGLPQSADAERKSKANQLKAFLAFYDQLLGNYLSQLNNIGQLFSIDKQASAKLKKTYYNKFLTEDELGASLYNNGTALEDFGGTTIGANSLQRLTESHDDYLDRRNRFLDHLLARFAEDFTDYALMIFSTDDDDTQQELINDKTSFLSEYPTISAERGKAFNYKNRADLWDTNNVAGLKKRVSKLLGMPDYLRQDYHCPTIRDEFEIIKVGSKYSFHLKWGTLVTHTSPKQFDTKEEAFYGKEEAIELATESAHYTTKSVGGGQHIYQVGIIDPNDASFNDIFLDSSSSPSETKATEAAIDFRHQMQRDFSRTPLYEFLMMKNGTNYTFQFMHRNQVILSSPKTFTVESIAWEAHAQTSDLVLDTENYTSLQVGTKFIYQVGILDKETPLNSDIFCESTQQYDSEEDALEAAEELVRLLKRVCLSCNRFDSLIEQTGSDFTFFLKEEGNTILTAKNNYSSLDEALAAKEKTIDLAFEKNSYTVETSGAEFVFQVGDVLRDEALDIVLTNEVLATSNETFASEQEAAEAATILQRSMNAVAHCEVEGMHLIEHILLRPQLEFHDHFMEVCLGDDCFFCGEEDPYSFRASVVLPYWVKKFSLDDPKLRKRKYVDRILRQEAPAHVHLKICWIDNYQMRLLDLYFRRWLEENAKTYPNKKRLSNRLNALIDLLGKLWNRYPEGFLHDCDDSEEENTILLGKSFLGSFNSPESN